MGPEVMAAASIASAAASAGSAAMQASSTMGGAAGVGGIGEYNAQINEANAVRARQAAQSDVADIRRAGARQQGTAQVVYGVSNVDPTQGSAAEVLTDNAGEIELDALRRLYRGETEARGYTQQAQLDRMRGENAGRGAGLEAGAQLLEGGAKAYRALDGSGLLKGGKAQGFDAIMRSGLPELGPG